VQNYHRAIQSSKKAVLVGYTYNKNINDKLRELYLFSSQNNITGAKHRQILKKNYVFKN